MPGGLLQLITIGEQDKIFFYNPEITLFKIVYKKTTSFSLDSIKQNISLKFNQNNIIKISKSGDLLKSLAIKIDFPSINAIYTKTFEESYNDLINNNNNIFSFNEKIYNYNNNLLNCILTYIRYIYNLFNHLYISYNNLYKLNYIPYNDYFVYITDDYNIKILYQDIFYGNILKIKSNINNVNEYINRQNSTYIKNNPIFNSTILTTKNLDTNINIKIINFDNNIYNIIDKYYNNLYLINNLTDINTNITQIQELYDLNNEILNNIINISIKDSIIALPINILLDNIKINKNIKIVDQYMLFNKFILSLSNKIITNNEILIIDQINNFKNEYNTLNDNISEKISFKIPNDRFLIEISLDNVTDNIYYKNNNFLLFETFIDISGNQFYLYTTTMINISNNFSFENISIIADIIKYYDFEAFFNNSLIYLSYINQIYVYINSNNIIDPNNIIKYEYYFFNFNKKYILENFKILDNNIINKQFFEDHINAYIIIRYDPLNINDKLDDNIIGSILFIYNNFDNNYLYNNNIYRVNPLLVAQIISYELLNNNTYKINIYLGSDIDTSKKYYIFNNINIPITNINYIENTNVNDNYKKYDITNLVDFVYDNFTNYTNKQLNNLIYNNLLIILSNNLIYINNIFNFLFNSLICIRSSIAYNTIGKSFKLINQDYVINNNLYTYFSNILIGLEKNGINNYANYLLFILTNLIFNYQIGILNSFKSIASSVDISTIDITLKTNDYIRNKVKTPLISFLLDCQNFNISNPIDISGSHTSQDNWNKLKLIINKSPYTDLNNTVQYVYKFKFSLIQNNIFNQLKSLLPSYYLKLKSIIMNDGGQLSTIITMIDIQNILNIVFKINCIEFDINNTLILTIYSDIDITNEINILNNFINNNMQILFNIYDSNNLLLNKYGQINLNNNIIKKTILYLVVNDDDYNINPLDLIPFIEKINNYNVEKIDFLENYWYYNKPLDNYYSTYITTSTDHYLHYFYLKMILDINHIIVSDINNNYVNNPINKFINLLFHKLYYFNYKALIDFENQISNAENGQKQSGFYYFYNIIPSNLINSSNEIINNMSNHIEYIFYFKYNNDYINDILININDTFINNDINFTFIDYNKYINSNININSYIIDVNVIDFYDKIYFLYFCFIKLIVKLDNKNKFNDYDIRHYHKLNIDTNLIYLTDINNFDKKYFYNIHFSHFDLFQNIKKILKLNSNMSLDELILYVKNNFNDDNIKIVKLLNLLLFYLFIIFNSKLLLLNKTTEVGNDTIIIDNIYLFNDVIITENKTKWNYIDYKPNSLVNIIVYNDVIYDKTSDRIFSIYWYNYCYNNINNLSYYTPYIKVIDNNYTLYNDLIKNIYDIKYYGKYSFDIFNDIEKIFNIKYEKILDMNNYSKNWNINNNKIYNYYLRSLNINSLGNYIQNESNNITSLINNYYNNSNILSLNNFLIPNNNYYSDINFGKNIILNEVLTNNIFNNVLDPTKIILKDNYNIIDKEIFTSTYNSIFFDLTTNNNTFISYINYIKSFLDNNNLYAILLTYILSNSIFSKYKSIKTIIDLSNYNKFLIKEPNNINLLYETFKNSDFKIIQINLMNNIQNLVIHDTYISSYLVSFFDNSLIDFSDKNVNNLIKYQRNVQLLKYNYVKISDKIFDCINNLSNFKNDNNIFIINNNQNNIKFELINRIYLHWKNNDITLLNKFIDSNYIIINNIKFFYFKNVLMTESEYNNIFNLTYDFSNKSIGINDFIINNYNTDDISKTAKIFRKTDLPTGYFFKLNNNNFLIDSIYNVNDLWIVVYELISNLISNKYYDSNIYDISYNINSNITNTIILDHNINNYNKIAKITLFNYSEYLIFINNIKYFSKYFFINKYFIKDYIIDKIKINDIIYYINTDYTISNNNNLFKFTFNNYLDIPDNTSYTNMKIDFFGIYNDYQKINILDIYNENAIILDLIYDNTIIIEKILIDNYIEYKYDNNDYIFIKYDNIFNYKFKIIFNKSLGDLNINTSNNIQIKTNYMTNYNDNKIVNYITNKKILLDLEYNNNIKINKIMIDNLNIYTYNTNYTFNKDIYSNYIVLQFDNLIFDLVITYDTNIKAITNIPIYQSVSVINIENIRSTLIINNNNQINIRNIKFGVNNIILNDLNMEILNTNYTVNNIYNLIDINNLIILFNKLKDMKTLVKTIYDKYDSSYLCNLERNLTVSDIFYDMIKDIITNNININFDNVNSEYIITPYNIFIPDNIIKDNLDIKYKNKYDIINSMINNNNLLKYNRNLLLDNDYNDLITRDYYPKFKYINYLGDFIINNLSWWLNNIKIEEMNNYYIHIFNNLYQNKYFSKQSGRNKLIGNYFNNLILSTSKNNFSLYINLPLSFTHQSGLAFPLVALSQQELYLHIFLLSLDDITIKKKNIKLNINSTFKYELYLDTVYLDTDERKLFGMSRHEYLYRLPIIQNQIVINNNNNIEIPVMINNPTIDLFVFSQNIKNINNKNYFNFTTDEFIPIIETSTYNQFKLLQENTDLKNNDIFKKWYEYANNFYYLNYINNNNNNNINNFYTNPNFSNKLDILLLNYPHKYNNLFNNLYLEYLYSLDKNFLISNINLNVSGKNRFNCNHQQLLDINNYQYYNHDIKGLYTYSFSLNNQELQPSGTFNFSKTNQPKLIIDINKNINMNNKYNINVICRTYNIFRLMSGFGSLTFD